MDNRDVRKVRPLLDILEAQKKPVWYFAIELSRDCLIRAMDKLSKGYRYVKPFALWGTIADGIRFYNGLGLTRPRLFLSLGSLYGNDHFHRAVSNLRTLKEGALTSHEDAILLTMDATSDMHAIWRSYHDEQGVLEQFIRNGFKHSNKVLGHEWYRDEDWELHGEFKTDPITHRFVLRAKRHTSCPAIGLSMSTGEEIDCYEVFKYSPELMRKQFSEAGLEEQTCWKAPNAEICKCDPLLSTNP